MEANQATIQGMRSLLGKGRTLTLQLITPCPHLYVAQSLFWVLQRLKERDEYFVKWFCTSDGIPHCVLTLLSALSLCHHCHSAGMGQDLTIKANVIAGAISLLKGCPFKFTPMIVNLHVWVDCFREGLTSLMVDIPGLSSPPLVLSWFLWCVSLKFSYTYPWDMKQSVGYLHAKSFQSCPTLCNPMHCSLPGSSVHGIFQARILVCFLPGDLPNPGIEPGSPAWQADSLPLSHQESPKKKNMYMQILRAASIKWIFFLFI